MFHLGKKTVLSVLILIILIGGTFITFGLTKHKSSVIKPTPVNTNQASNVQKLSTPSQQPAASNSTIVNTKPDSPVAQQSATLTAPSGSFVSNHKPNLSAQPAPNTEESTCNIVTGASCDITFSSGSSSFSLGKQTAGASGIVAWHWSLQGLGLTEGSWKITATASLNGQTLSTSDPLMLQVAQ